LGSKNNPPAAVFIKRDRIFDGSTVAYEDQDDAPAGTGTGSVIIVVGFVVVMWEVKVALLP
jgi:hypothetical protein